MLADHEGKPSNIRILAAVSMTTGCVLGLAPLWGAPTQPLEVLALFVLGGPALKVWQYVGGERRPGPPGPQGPAGRDAR